MSNSSSSDRDGARFAACGGPARGGRARGPGAARGGRGAAAAASGAAAAASTEDVHVTLKQRGAAGRFRPWQCVTVCVSISVFA